MKKRILLLFTFLLTLSTIGLAIETTLTAEKITLNSKGKEVRESAKKANPGDIIEYTFYIDNTESMSQHQLEPSIPIPTNMVLIPKSITPIEFKVSVDGKNYVNFPVIGENGKNVPNSAYKSIKWNIKEIKSNEKISVKLRTKINS